MRLKTNRVINIIAVILVLTVFLYLIVVYVKNSRDVAVQAQDTSIAPNGYGSVSFSEITSGSRSNARSRVNYLITSDEGLEKLWKMLDTVVPPPDVDFKKNQVIVVFAGERQGSGHEIRVTRVLDGDIRDVTVESSEPATDCEILEGITSPYQVVMISATDLDLTHKDVSVKKNCERQN